MNENRLLIVEDDPDFRDLVALVGEELGFTVSFAAAPHAFPDMVKTFAPRVIVLDLMMPDVDGVQVLRTLADQKCDAAILLVSAAEPSVLQSTARVALSRGLKVGKIIRKPIELDQLASVLRGYLSLPAVTAEDLRQAIENRQITVNYQPKISLATAAEWVVDGVEALARWNHPQHGPILPGDFFAVAQETGLIDTVTTTIVRTAMAQSRQLLDNGYKVDISVNIPAHLLGDKGFPDALHRELVQHRLDGATFILEVTESAPFAQSVILMENLSRIRLKGIRLSMDDFGIGYSSLAQLTRIPFSELKIDRCFIREVDTTEETRVVVRSIVELAHKLGLSVCAEGVETRETLAFLRSVGCDQAQGFLISQPVDGNALARFLADNLYQHTTRLAAAKA